MTTLQVNLGDRSYPIVIGSGALDDSISLRKAIAGKQVLIVTNTTVAPLYLSKLRASLSHLADVDTVILPDGEEHKNLATVGLIYDTLLKRPHHRSTTVVALGGGVVGDMAGFAAATYQRGVNFVQVPTTLLAQVDSSVGGKTGVNHPLGKNMIGAFHQPKSVLIDTAVLETLPAREFSAGLAEVIKYGLIRNHAFFEWLEANMSRLLARDPEALEYAIQVSCQTKAAIVAADEKEEGERALLNLGHTFGHAIEAWQGYRDWLHGEAVACGIVIAANVSMRHYGLPQRSLDDIRSLLQKAALPVAPPAAMSVADFWGGMQRDKKILTGKIRYILLQTIGQGVIADDVPPELVEAAIGDCR